MTTEPSKRERVVSLFIDAPIERVWDEITKTGSVQRALYNTTMIGDLTPRKPDPVHERGPQTGLRRR